jgi:hypothetical protein
VIAPQAALCGHAHCDPYRRRNSVLDEQGDVVIYNACTGVRHVFRDNVCHDLILGPGWTLTCDGETDPAATLACDGDRSWKAMWPSGRVFLRHDTAYGLVAKVARRLLNPASCCN